MENFTNTINIQAQIIKKQEKENELLRQCVEFYADKANWVELGGMNHILDDEYVSDQFYGKSGGKCAKECLTKLEQK